MWPPFRLYSWTPVGPVLLGWHPCGLGIDWLRNAYRAKMKTVSYLPPVDVVWFQVPNDTPMFGKACAFRSRFWFKEPFNDGIGEQNAGRTCCKKMDVEWYNGAVATEFSGGLVPCGSDAVAKSGAGPDDPVFATTIDGSAPCCAGPPAWTSTLLPFTGPTLSFFHGKGNSIAEGAFFSLFDFDAVPPLSTGRFNFFPFNTIEYNREGAPEAVVVFTGDPEAPDTIDLDFPNVSTETIQVVFWGVGVARFLIRFNVSGNTHQIDILWS